MAGEIQNGTIRAQSFSLLVFAVCVAILLGADTALGGNEGNLTIVYQSPRPGVDLVSPDTAIALRFASLAGPELLDTIDLSATGSLSGAHVGRKILAGDGRTLIFKPEDPFLLGETVLITVTDAPIPISREGRDTYVFEFKVAASIPVTPAGELSEAIWQPTTHAAAARPPHDYRTAPPQIPPFAVTHWPGTPAYGYILIGAYNYYPPRDIPGYLLILDNAAELVYYSSIEDLPILIDFKQQENGLLTYYVPAPGYNRFYALNNRYQVVDDYRVGSGYSTDHHDLQVLENGNALMLIHEARVVDLSQLVPGGSKSATVIGCVVQEVDGNDNVVFEWRSWDHFNILSNYS